MPSDALGAAAVPLKGRPHRTVLDRLPSILEPDMGSGIASATVKILHKALPAPVAGHQCPTSLQVTKMAQTH